MTTILHCGGVVYSDSQLTYTDHKEVATGKSGFYGEKILHKNGRIFAISGDLGAIKHFLKADLDYLINEENIIDFYMPEKFRDVNFIISCVLDYNKETDVTYIGCFTNTEGETKVKRGFYKHQLTSHGSGGLDAVNGHDLFKNVARAMIWAGINDEYSSIVGFIQSTSTGKKYLVPTLWDYIVVFFVYLSKTDKITYWKIPFMPFNTVATLSFAFYAKFTDWSVRKAYPLEDSSALQSMLHTHNHEPF